MENITTIFLTPYGFIVGFIAADLWGKGNRTQAAFIFIPMVVYLIIRLGFAIYRFYSI